MFLTRPFFLLLLFFFFFAALVAGGSAPLFCKCTCFKNSTLIPLKPGSTCGQCTHAFCLSQSLPICSTSSTPSSLSLSSSISSSNSMSTEQKQKQQTQESPESDIPVLSTCIQRDSRKDQVIVWAFLLGTAGLLAWAALKRVREAKGGKSRSGSSPSSLSAGAGASSSRGAGGGVYAPVTRTG
ncbi:hypothetical protein F5Y17DRAFT_478044 [Xylariaceae sp. FL0594]|nr:hypothetical protein F5Y17DRAFT_478044 [Xylariaceae sp. FL0594]